MLSEKILNGLNFGFFFCPGSNGDFHPFFKALTILPIFIAELDQKSQFAIRW
jgi:hypothetical protein